MYVDSWFHNCTAGSIPFASPVGNLPSGTRVGRSQPMNIENPDGAIQIEEVRRGRLRQLRDEMFGGAFAVGLILQNRQPAAFGIKETRAKPGPADIECNDIFHDNLISPDCPGQRSSMC